MSDGIKLIHTSFNNSVQIYQTTIEWNNTHLIKCKKCGTVIMQQRVGTQCNCGRICNSTNGIAVFNIDDFEIFEL